MDDLPPPLTPACCDLRGMPFMPLDLTRLFDSDFYALSTGDEFKAAFTLWGKSFFQVPAASLPDDDRILAHLSGSGSAWGGLRDMALRGWVKCSDGRLYHPVVAQKAMDAWEGRLAQRARTEAAREAAAAARAAKLAKSQSADKGSDSRRDDMRTDGVTRPDTSGDTESVTDSAATSVTDSVTASKYKGEGEYKKKDSEASLLAAEPQPMDARTVLWREGLPRLCRISGKPDKAARILLGKLVKEARDDCALVSAVLHEAESTRPIDPMAWVTRSLRIRTGQDSSGQSKLGWMLKP